MNYRHAYHAGNFADVVKHTVLALIVDYLKRKDKAFRVVDTHAGIGLYDLGSAESGRTGEWRDGIGRIVGGSLPAPVERLLQPYLGAVRSVNSGAELTRYPGSPLIVRHLLRKQDRLTAIELHPADAKQLAKHFDGDFQARVIELDGWLAPGAHLPPKEKRGLVLIDPPFEQDGEFRRLLEGLSKAHRRWPGGIYALWYPIKDRRAVNVFRSGLAELGVPKILDIRFEIRPASREPSLDGSGMIVVNPPFTLEAQLRSVLPALHRLLAREPGGRWSLEWIAGDHGADDENT